MSRNTVVQFRDDVDGVSDPDYVRYFSVDGTGYEIDLNEKHSVELDEALERFREVARLVPIREMGPAKRVVNGEIIEPSRRGGRRPSTSAGLSIAATRKRNNLIVEWAEERGRSDEITMHQKKRVFTDELLHDFEAWERDQEQGFVNPASAALARS